MLESNRDFQQVIQGGPYSPAHISKCNCEVTKVDKIIQFFAK